MNRDSLWSLLWLLIPVALVLMALGVLLVPTLTSEDAPCGLEPSRLGPPSHPSTVAHALQDLYEEGIISSVEEGVDAISRTGWVLDPADDHRLEYWITFGEGRGMSTTGFEVICIGPDKDDEGTVEMVWKYDGLQVVPSE